MNAEIFYSYREPFEVTFKLLDYLDTCDENEKFYLLKILRLCHSEGCLIDEAIFTDFPSATWGKELLIYTLLSKNTTWNIHQANKFVKEIDKLNILINQRVECYTIEDVLKIILEAQKKCYLDIGFIARVLMLVRSKESLDIISEDLFFSSSILSQLELLHLKQKCDNCRIIYDDDEQIKNLRCLLLYSDEINNATLSKVKANTHVTDVINFFEAVKHNDIREGDDFLSHLTQGHSVDDWKHEISLLTVEKCIQKEFPSWTNLIVELNDKTYHSLKKKLKPSCSKYCLSYNPQKKELNSTLESKNDDLFLRRLLHDLNETLTKLISNRNLPDKTWRKIKFIIRSLDTENKIIQLIDALEILIEWRIDIIESEALETIMYSTEIDVQKNIHNFVINKFFSRTYEKSVVHLIGELMLTNIEENIQLLKNRGDLKQRYDDVMHVYSRKPHHEGAPIENWNRDAIGEWAKRSSEIRVRNLSEYGMKINDSEKIAVIIRAIELTTGIKPRVIQILSVILLLNCEQSRGRFAQINTGEGKTVIIAMIAAYHALDGRKVDVITSSRLLAIPQSERLKPFYKILKLNVSHNFEPSAYSCDVVYGTASQFQGDILHEEFMKLNIRGGRNCDVAIVDEVDNMLVDGKDQIVLLSRDMPAMDHLETLLAMIYMQIKMAAASITIEEGQLYFVERENTSGIIKNLIPIDGTARDFIARSTESYMRKSIRDCDASILDKDTPEIKVPKHLREFICKIQLKKWIASAILAKFEYENKKHYIIYKDEVKIVDVHDTGVIQMNMQWSDGLHQFIQMKHGMKITPESLTTNFISNVSYFRRYRPHIYGLTGTIDCQGTRTLLKNTYNVDTVIIPPFKLKQHHQLVSIIVDKKSDWLREIVKKSLLKLKNGRAVLIITQYIRQIEAIKEMFIDNFSYDRRRIRVYKTNDDSSIVEKLLIAGDVLIATNIAGRGTDIGVAEEVEVNGGLHVCLTFLPKNSRVEEQNIGRTSRTGNRGTSQLILCSSEMDIAKLRQQRHDEQKKALKDAEKKIERVTMKDEIFSSFCRLKDMIYGRNKFVRDIERKAVEERFAIWLKMNDDRITNEPKSQVEELFELFQAKILEDERNGKLVDNPYMYVDIGNKYLEKKKFIDAIREYTMAVELDSNFAEHAYYNRGYAYIAEYGSDIERNGHFIDAAISDFTTARKLIEERECHLHLIQNAAESQLPSKQIENKLNLYNIQKNAINIAIGPDKAAISQDIRNLEASRSKTQFNSDDWREISEIITNLEKERDSVGAIQEAREKGYNLKIQVLGMKKCLPAGDESHNCEVKEFERNGAIGGFEISEVRPIKIASIVGLFFLGLGQIVAGVALLIYAAPLAFRFGLHLISAGISDIVSAVKDGIINRDFSWATWGINKALTLVRSVVAAAWSAIKSVALTAKSGAQAFGLFGKGVISGSARKIGVQILVTGGTEIAKSVTNYVIDQKITQKIQEKIIEQFEGKITETLEKNALIKMMLELDKANNNNHYENHIRTLGLELLSATNVSNFSSDIIDIGQKICNQVVDNYVSGLSAVLQVGKLLKTVVELSTMKNKFTKELNKAIDEFAKRNEIQKLYENHLKSMNQRSFENDRIIVEQDDFNRTDKDVDLNLLCQVDEKIKLQIRDGGPSRISKMFCHVISALIIKSMNKKLFTPAAHGNVDYTMDHAASYKTETLKELRKTHKANKRLADQVGEGSIKEKARTMKEMRDCVEYSERIQKIEKSIDDVRSGGPSSLVVLGAAGCRINRPIKLYDDNGIYQYTIGDDKRGTPVEIQYHKPKNDEIGHYTMLGIDETYATSIDRNMSLYNALSAQTGDNPEELKEDCLMLMENNKSEMAELAKDIKRLEMYSKIKAAMGGTIYNDNFHDDACQLGRQSTNASGYRSLNDVVDTNVLETEFSTEFEKKFVTHHALKVINAQKARMNPNNLKSSSGRAMKENVREVLWISDIELKLPRIAYGVEWKNVETRGSIKPIKAVVVILQYEENEENEFNVDSHVQAIYPQF